MRDSFKALVAAAGIGAAALAAVPAQAYDRGGAAVAAGILGVGVGAAIASDHRGYYGVGYRPYGYGYGGYYAPPPPPPPPPGYYGGYYGPRPYYGPGYYYGRPHYWHRGWGYRGW